MNPTLSLSRRTGCLPIGGQLLALCALLVCHAGWSQNQGFPTSAAASSVSNNIVTTVSSAGVSNVVENITGLDPSAMTYANVVGCDDPSRARVNSFVRWMKNTGLWASLNDGVLLRTNFNPSGSTAAITLVNRASVTNHGTLLWDGAGAKTDGATGWLNMPVSSLTSAFTVVVVYAGHTNAPGTADPFDLCNRSGTAAGEFSPRNNGNGEMRLALRCTAAEEISSVSTAGFPNGWFKLLQGFYYLECNDFRIHQVAVSYDNAGTAAGYVDNEQGLTATGFSTVITNGALNDLTLGCSRDASGNAQMFAKCNFAAAFVFNKVLSATEVSLLQLCYRQLEPFKVDITIGDSESAFNFIGRTGEPGIGTDQSTNTMNWWPAVAANGWQAFGWELGQPPYDQVRPVNVAISGTKAATWDSTWLTNFLINFLPGKGPTTDARASTWLGINDLGGDVATATTFYGHQTNIWWFFRTNAVRIRAFTLPAVGTPFNTALVPAGYLNESLRAQYNSVIRSDPTKYNELIDLDLIMTTNNMATNASPLLSYDGLHPTIGGHLVIVSNLFTTFPAGFYKGMFNGSVPLTNNDSRQIVFPTSLSINGVILSNDIPNGYLSFKDSGNNFWGIGVLSAAITSFMQVPQFLNSDGSLRMNTGWQLGSAKSILFSSTSDANGTADLGLTRTAAGVMRITDASAGTGWLQWAGESYLAADFTSATATLANTALSKTVTSGRKYAFTCVLYLADSTAADGVKIACDGGAATATNFRAHFDSTDTTAGRTTQVTALATALDVALSGTGNSMLTIQGSFEPSSTGTFIIRAAQHAHSTGTLTIFRGSHLEIHDYP